MIYFTNVCLHLRRHNSVVLTLYYSNSFHSLDDASQRRCERFKCQTQICPQKRHHENITPENENKYSICWASIRLEDNECCNPTREFHENSKFADFPLDVNYNWLKISSQSNERYGLTLLDQTEYTKCRFIRSDSGAIQLYQTSEHGNSKYSSARFAGSDYLPEWTLWNKQLEQQNSNFWFPITKKGGKKIIPQYRNESLEIFKK